MIVEALRFLLPPDLLFLISDRGTHFTADAFETLMRSEEFIHVLIARHRPQSNGIAERFVRSLKEWLRDKSWQDDQELAALLDQFLAEYNDRPHQGLSIPGLSPNEFANRHLAILDSTIILTQYTISRFQAKFGSSTPLELHSHLQYGPKRNGLFDTNSPECPTTRGCNKRCSSRQNDLQSTL